MIIIKYYIRRHWIDIQTEGPAETCASIESICRGRHLPSRSLNMKAKGYPRQHVIHRTWRRYVQD